MKLTGPLRGQKQGKRIVRFFVENISTRSFRKLLYYRLTMHAADGFVDSAAERQPEFSR
ncbi:MAG: hypothetical protein KA746_11365 [Pyrinomonadaceae bacterium]|nr:hypothetical protein [Pyrinomonadaceae bacterium]